MKHSVTYCSRDRNLRDRDLVESSRPKTRLHKKFRDRGSRLKNLWILRKCFKNMSSPLLSWIFFEYLEFYPQLLVVSYLQIQQRRNVMNFRNFAKPYPCNIECLKTIGLWPRPVAFETKRETWNFRDRCRKNGSRDESRNWNQVSRLHHWENYFHDWDYIMKFIIIVWYVP